MTRVKFKCISVTKREGWGGAPFIFEAEMQVCGGGYGGGDSEEFFAATPSGSIKLGTVKDDHFVVGQSYYVDFTPAPAWAPARCAVSPVALGPGFRVVVRSW